MPGNNSVFTKVVVGGNCGEGSSTIRTSSAGRTTKKPPTLSASKVLRKAPTRIIRNHKVVVLGFFNLKNAWTSFFLCFFYFIY